MIKYRPEIDGLRTIAVVSVVIYHAELFLFEHQVFSGGFLGVDIFFVISGYLITSIILREVEENRFSIRNFYERRVRRLLPALFTVIAASLPLAIWLMTSSALKEYAGSVLSSLLFSSNIWFWLEDSYVAEPSRLKPFLHTWTLSVEEQFYIFFPVAVLLVCKLRKAYLLSFLVLVFLVSLQLSQFASTRWPDSNFFLIPTRGWELMAGAILAKLELDHGRTNFPTLNAIMPTAGLAMILWSLVSYTDGMLHPGYVTVLPVVGTCMIVWFSGAGEPVGDILRTRIMVWVGLISYSLYLWHYPIFAFARIAWNEPGPLIMAWLAALAFLLSVITYRFVERPFRNRERMPVQRLILVLVPAAILLTAANLAIYLKDGEFRSEDRLAFTQEQIEAGRSDRLRVLRSRCAAVGWEACDDVQDGRFNILIVGDSHAPDALNIMDVIYPQAHFMRSELAGCPPMRDVRSKVRATHPNLARCEEINQERFDRARYEGVDLVVISYLGGWFGSDDVEPYLAFLRDDVTVPTLMLGNYIAYTRNMPEVLNDGTVEDLPQYELSRFAFEDENRLLAEQYGVLYVSKRDAMCDSDECLLFVGDVPFTWDGHHLSLEFARSIGEVVSPDVRLFIETLDGN